MTNELLTESLNECASVVMASRTPANTRGGRDAPVVDVVDMEHNPSDGDASELAEDAEESGGEGGGDGDGEDEDEDDEEEEVHGKGNSSCFTISRH